MVSQLRFNLFLEVSEAFERGLLWPDLEDHERFGLLEQTEERDEVDSTPAERRVLVAQPGVVVDVAVEDALPVPAEERELPGALLLLQNVRVPDVEAEPEIAAEEPFENRRCQAVAKPAYILDT